MEDNYFRQFDDGVPLFGPRAGLFAAVACVFICDFALDEMVPQALVKALLVIQTLGHKGCISDGFILALATFDYGLFHAYISHYQKLIPTYLQIESL